MKLFLPDWIPNIHPLIIHFPIVMVLLTLLGATLIILYRRESVYHAYLFILSLTWLSISATYISGRVAIKSVLISGETNLVINQHADYALILLVYFTLYLLFALILWKCFHFKKIALIFGNLFLGIIGAGIMVNTADLGGRLVYAYGTGVRQVSNGNSVHERTQQGSTILRSPNGSWQWNWAQNQQEPFAHEFSWIVGSNNDLQIQQSIDSSLSIGFLGHPIMFTVESSLSGVQIDAKINLSEFEGEFSIIHHVQTKNTYDYFSINDQLIYLGRMENGKTKIIQSNPLNNMEPLDIRVFASGRHYRSYINGIMVLHGHKDDLPAGNVGLYINGKGTINFSSFVVSAINKIN